MCALRVYPAFAQIRRRKSAPTHCKELGGGRAEAGRSQVQRRIRPETATTTVGCAKSLLIGEYREPGQRRGSQTALRHRGERIGTVVRTRADVKPVIVSPGHDSDFATAARWVLRLAPKYRIPEVIRLAHREVNQMRRERTPGMHSVNPLWEGFSGIKQTGGVENVCEGDKGRCP
jgi:deoxyribonuclease V